MALIKFGSLVTSGSGSLGGHTIQNSKGGCQLRTKPINKKKPSSAQSRIRSINSELQNAWRFLVPVVRDNWLRYAAAYQVPAKAVASGILSGHSLFMKYNYVYLAYCLPIQSNPYKAAIGPFGSELIVNGSFAGLSPWSAGAGFTYSPGKLTFDNVSSDYFRQSLTILDATQYRLSFDVLDTAYDTSIYFRGTGFARLFNPPVPVYNYYTAGSQCILCTSIIPSDRIIFYCYARAASYAFTNISLKQVIS